MEHRLLLRLLGDLAGARVLDVGCGDGTWAVICRRLGAARVVGCDADPRMVARAAARMADAGGRPDVLVARVEALPFPDACFDIVTVITVLTFVPDVDQALRGMARVLRLGGRLVIGDLGRWNCWAARRRVPAWLGFPAWRAARFRSVPALRRLVSGAGLRADAVTGAIYFPPVTALARWMAPRDTALGRLTTLGAAFLAVVGRQP